MLWICGEVLKMKSMGLEDTSHFAGLTTFIKLANAYLVNRVTFCSPLAAV